MKLLVLASPALLEELTAQPVADTVELIPAASIDDHLQELHADVCMDLLFDNTQHRVTSLINIGTPLVIINSVLQTPPLTPPEFIRINGWPTMLSRTTIEATGGNENTRSQALHVFTDLGRKTEWVPDVTGMVTPRIICSIINEAFFSLEEKISSMEQIDTAMKLGTNYPFGPFEWGEKIGLKNVYLLLAELAKYQARYRPAGSLETIALA